RQLQRHDVALADAARGEALRDARDAISELAPGQPHRGAALLAKTDQRSRVALLACPAIEVVGEYAVGPDSPLALHRDPARIDLHPLHRPSSRPVVPGLFGLPAPLRVALQESPHPVLRFREREQRAAALELRL